MRNVIKKSKEFLGHAASELLVLLWPEVCPFCGKVSRNGPCISCQKKADRLLVEEPRCMKCGKPVRYKEQEYCYDCRNTHHYYDRGVGLWLHQKPVSTSIYQLKYHNQRYLAKFYAEEIDKYHKELVRRWNPQVLIPVPLHPKRRRKRGYNQAELLAKELGKLWDIPVDNRLVKRVRYTNPLKQMNPGRRKKNLETAFEVVKTRRMYDRVLIIDDIYTTGNTIDAVAKVLKRARVRNVFFLTISIGLGD